MRGAMLSTHTPDDKPESKEVKQWIKSKLVLSLKALQKRCVTTDSLVTSEDADANLLCCALEAVFLHGIKSKHIRLEAGGRGRKGGPLPQPVFWALLKSVTHRNVTLELEQLSYISTDVGRCRAWVRLALNDGLVECYLTSLLRENSKLAAYYQPTALMLDLEEREVLLSYLQGLASLSFQLSYKSSMLNEWTVTPLALAGLCPATSGDLDLLPSPVQATQPKRKESWDTVSQSSGGSDSVEVQRASSRGGDVRAKLTSSSLSLDTTGSSQLSSSLSSDSLLQGNSHKSPEKETWPDDLCAAASACGADGVNLLSQDAGKPLQQISVDSVDSKESSNSSQDSFHMDFCLTPDLLVETVASSGSDSEKHDSCVPITHAEDRSSVNTVLVCTQEQEREETINVPTATPSPPRMASPPLGVTEASQADGKCELLGNHCSGSSPTRKASAEPLHSPTTSLPKCRSWISEDDFYKPQLDETAETEEEPHSTTDQINGLTSSAEESPQLPASVVHRRQIGLSNPFRGLLKLGHLERRGAVGIWRRYYCELSPFELRFYLNDEDRSCDENCSLLRCEDISSPSAEGRFELAFQGKRLYLRGASRDEAEDWVDRIIEAVNKCRPLPRDEQWQVLEGPPLPEGEPSTPSPPSSPEQLLEEEPKLEWCRMAEPELDAIKETVLYLSLDDKTWVPLLFSLSLEALRSFRMQEGRKIPRATYPIDGIRDVVPDSSQGSPAFFRVLTGRETLKLRAQNEDEARSWRALIRGALDSYLDSCEDEAPVAGGSQGGNIHKLVQHGLKEERELLPFLYSVATEKGLDAQNFKCAGCSRQIGFSFGKPRLCEFSGQYYCDSCHHGDAIIIPSRMLHNWDLQAREVSQSALKLLTTVAYEPLLNVEALNPGLWEHAAPMDRVHNLRQRLRLLGDYLLTCHSGFIRKVHDRLDQRNYLLESYHLYSVKDLHQVADGQYEAFLQSLIHFASKHVYHCDLCTQRGFICQICNANEIIFPFEFETTTRCKACKTVFHLACKAQSPSCPRCLRLQKYLEREMQE